MKEFKAKRKLFEIGIAPHDAVICLGVSPHGLISIGAIPHGLISIGLVPMGIISFGCVSMGLLSAGIMSMGLVSFGSHNMTMLQMNVDETQPKEPGAEGHMHHHHMSH
jgi:GLTT repeat (6 copies)